MQHQPQRRQVAAVGDLVSIIDGGERRPGRQLRADRRVVRPEVERRLQLQADRPLAFDQPVVDVDGVLPMDKKDLFFQHEAIDP